MPSGTVLSAPRQLTPAMFCWLLMALSTYGCSDRRAAPITSPPDTATTAPTLRTFDLRFKGVGTLSDSLDLVHENVFVGLGSALDLTFESAAGSPLTLGGGGVCGAAECDWFFDAFALPHDVAPVGARYSGNILENLDAALDTNAVTDTVITSLDIRATPGVFGISQAVDGRVGGYRLVEHAVALANLAGAAAAEGSQKRVITALSFDSGNIRYLAYSWEHDTTVTAYDTQVVTGAQGDVPAAAQALGASGYVVTALGGNTSDGFVLVGTRAHGDTRARSVLINPVPGANLAGYAMVGDLIDAEGNVTVVYQQ